MISRKCFYTYRMLTARLHEVAPVPTNQKAGFTVASDAHEPRQILLDDELTEHKPKPALMLTAGRKR